MAQVNTGTSLWLVRLIMGGLGVGVSFVFIPAQAVSMATISKAQTGQASPIFNAGKQRGGRLVHPGRRRRHHGPGRQVAGAYRRLNG